MTKKKATPKKATAKTAATSNAAPMTFERRYLTPDRPARPAPEPAGVAGADARTTGATTETGE